MSVDIALPTHNPDLALLERAIGSIVAQTFTAWTLWVIRDGGTVPLDELERRFTDARIHFLHVPHQGKAAALNVALRLGTAKYIAYLDDDDLWYPGHLATAVGTLTGQQLRFVHTDAWEVFVHKSSGSLEERSRNLLHRGLLSDVLLWYVSHVNTVHERSLWDEAGPYDEQRTVFIDWDMLLRMALLARPVHVPVATCEHFIYVDAANRPTNTISGIHATDPAYSRRMHDAMFMRAFELVRPEDFAAIVRELNLKTAQLKGLATARRLQR